MTKQHNFYNIENNLQKIGQSFFHLSHRTTVIQDLVVQRQFSLVQDNRTNVNVEACPSTCYLLNFGNLIVNPVHFLVTENIRRGQSRDNCIVLLFNSKYKRRWINIIFLLDKHSINAVS